MLKVLSLFSGIGAFEKALENIRINYELLGFSEIDKYAIKSYCAIHNIDEALNLGDITKIDYNKLPKNIDLITHGSPCQDFSIAGKQAGAEKDSGTRSSLMWNTVDIVKYIKPKYIIWENVKNLLSKKHRHNFDNYIKILEELGYNNYYQILNAKNYGIPQNRERVYTISIRKDIDKGNFVFPEKEKLYIKLKDILEKEVDEKYYLKNKGIKYVNKRIGSYTQLIENDTEIAHCPITALGNTNWTGNMVLEDETNKCIKVGNLDIKGQDCIKRVYSNEGISPTLTSMQGGNREPKIVERTPLKFLNRNQKNIEGDYAFCIDSSNTGGIKEIENNNIRIRKLTPKECWRLMRFF